MAQLWDQRLPPTNVAGVISGINAICGFILLLVLSYLCEVFPRVLRLSLHLKNQHFQIPIQPGIS